MATNSLQFLKFELEKNMSVEELENKILTENSEDDDKFIINEDCNNMLDGYYITYYNSKDIFYNSDTNSLETVIVKRNLIIPFCIDLNNKILDVWGSKTNANKLVVKLGILLNHKVTIDAIIINLENIVTKLKNKNVKIGNVKIDNYQIEKGIIANCIFDLKNHNNQLEIIKKYTKNLVKLSLILSNEEDEALTIIINNNGSVVIYKAKEDISFEILEVIRDICVR
ncbi:hypothetical protein CDLVIII_0181 [Clostridium sp. DL-VIII]|uniref:hypothetical protein n=1 Tax=Clostridium sp. DL-VIII TaxID=641107 RepID=UPI00023AF899|nr:hypothetical protein [Clostridium sp. DL-VIII]EHI96919.1 hypothetical protein CDLVIII_0181 [Clostridium sp. DL-VIII]